MSKGLGQKIAIKFTEDLVGDVAGNEGAFSIKGKEYNHVDGVLIDGDYQVEKVERYPISKMWEDDLGNGLQLEIEVPEIKGVDDTVESTTKTNSNYTTIANRVEFKKATTIAQIKIKTCVAGDYTLYIKDNNNDTVYETITKTNLSSDTWVFFDITPLAVSVGSQYKIEVSQPNGSSHIVSGLYNGEIWKCIEGIFGSDVWSNWCIAMGFVEQGTPNKYYAQKVHETIACLPNKQYRIKYISDEPTNTNIKIEVSTGETQGEWQEVSNGEVITIDTNLWIKVTLTTEDATVTPTLVSLWLEEPKQRQDTILLTMKPDKSFRNVEGNLNIIYKQALGNLKGLGGAVMTFERQFTPTELVQMPNPWIREKLTANVSTDIKMTKIDFISNDSVKEKLTATVSANIEFWKAEDAPI